MTVFGALARMWRRGVALVAMLLLPGCLALDTEDELREDLAQLVFLAQTRHFTSKPTCTAAIFDLVSDDVRARRVKTSSSVRTGLQRVMAGEVVAFDVPDMTPHDVSEALMSINLAEGMGVISSFVGPSRVCMDDQFQVDVYYALTRPETLMIYDPGGNALMLLHRPNQLLFFMRGNV